MNDSLEVKIISSADELELIRTDWINLREKYGMILPNNDPDHFFAVTNALGSRIRPHVVLLRDHNAPRALIIGRILKEPVKFDFSYLTLNTLRLSTLEIVYGGLITDKTLVSQEAIMKYLQKMLSQKEAEHIRIYPLPVNHELYKAIANSKSLSSGKKLHWYFKLVPGSYEDTIKKEFNRRHRHNIKKLCSHIIKYFNGKVALKVITQPDQVESFLRKADNIISKTYHAKISGTQVLRVMSSDQIFWTTILKLEAQRGKLRAYLLESQDKPICFLWGLVYDKIFIPQYQAFLTEYKQLSPGQVLLIYVIKDLCSTGIEKISYGFGDAEYKHAYGTYHTEEAMFDLYGKGWRPAATKLINIALICAERLIKLLFFSKSWLKSIQKKWRARIES